MLDIIELNEHIWEREVLQSQGATIVNFWDEYCHWCHKFNSIYEEVAKEYEGRIKFTKLNMKESPGNRRIATKHGIIGKPVLKFFLNGQVVGEAMGVKTKGRLKKVIRDTLGEPNKFSSENQLKL